MLFVGRRPAQPAVRTVSRDHVTTIKVEQHQQPSQQQPADQPSDEQLAVVSAVSSQGNRLVKENQRREQKRSGDRSTGEERPLEVELGQDQPRELKTKDQQPRGQQPRDQRTRAKKSRDQQEPAGEQKQPEQKESQARDQPVPEQPPGKEQRQAKQQQQLGKLHKPVERQRSGRQVGKAQELVVEKTAATLVSSAEELSHGAPAAVTVIVGPAALEVDHPATVQQEVGEGSPVIADAADRRRRQRQQREQFRKLNPEILSSDGGLGIYRAGFGGSNLAVDKLISGGRSSPAQLAVRHSFHGGTAVVDGDRGGNSDQEPRKRTSAPSDGITKLHNNMTYEKMAEPEPMYNRDRSSGPDATTAEATINRTAATPAAARCFEAATPAAGSSITAATTAAASSEDLNVLALITQDILDAMAQKPAHGGHYKELEEMLQVGR